MRWLRDLYEKHEWAVNLAQLLLALGVGGVIVKAIDAYVSLDIEWALAIFAFVTGLVLVSLQYAPHPARASAVPTTTTSEEWKRAGREEQAQKELKAQREEQKAKLEALLEVLATLGKQRGILQNWATSALKFQPDDRGEWDENKGALTGDPNFSGVVQYVNTAFNSLALLNPHSYDHTLHGRAGHDVENAMSVVEAAIDHGDWETT